MQECKEPETPFLDSTLSLAASHLDRSAIGCCHPLSPALRIRGPKAETTSTSKLGDESWPQVGGSVAWDARSIWPKSSDGALMKLRCRQRSGTKDGEFGCAASTVDGVLERSESQSLWGRRCTL